MSEAGCSPLHAEHYVDRAALVTAPIVENVLVARDTYRLRFEAPTIAERITPGQFVMLRLAGQDDPLLGRAFAMYDVMRDAKGKSTCVDIVYLVHGKLTTALGARQAGDQVEVWGPLGNGFERSHEKLEELILVAGGIGQTPFLAVGKEALGQAVYGDGNHRPLRSQRVTLCYGVRTKELLAGKAEFAAAGIDLRVASDDGSVGHHGWVTDLLAETLEQTQGRRREVLCCGPEPMMRGVAEICAAGNTPCRVSLETPMACGLGICFSCVAKVMQPDGEWDYKRTCVEGPIFDSTKIVW